MKWKRTVRVTTAQGEIVLCLGETQCVVPEADRYLVEAIENGIHEEETLKQRIMKQENTNEIMAGLTLAKFILDYQQFIEKNYDYYEITM